LANDRLLCSYSSPIFPCRKIAAPDDDARTAGRWLNQDIEQGFPLALARLALLAAQPSVEQPIDSRVTLPAQLPSRPVPLQSSGPFKVKNTEFAPGLKASIDGSYIGLLSAKEDAPFLIINRFTGEQVSESARTPSLRHRTPPWPPVKPIRSAPEMGNRSRRGPFTVRHGMEGRRMPSPRIHGPPPPFLKGQNRRFLLR